MSGDTTPSVAESEITDTVKSTPDPAETAPATGIKPLVQGLEASLPKLRNLLSRGLRPFRTTRRREVLPQPFPRSKFMLRRVVAQKTGMPDRSQTPTRRTEWREGSSKPADTGRPIYDQW